MFGCCCGARCFSFTDEFDRADIGDNYTQTIVNTGTTVTDWTIAGGAATCSTANRLLRMSNAFNAQLPAGWRVEFDLTTTGVAWFGGQNGYGAKLSAGGTVAYYVPDIPFLTSPVKLIECSTSSSPFHVVACNNGGQGLVRLWVNDTPIANAVHSIASPAWLNESGTTTLDNLSITQTYAPSPHNTGETCGTCGCHGWWPVTPTNHIQVTLANINKSLGGYSSCTDDAFSGTFIFDRVVFPVGSPGWLVAGSGSGSRCQYEVRHNFGCGFDRAVLTIPYGPGASYGSAPFAYHRWNAYVSFTNASYSPRLTITRTDEQPHVCGNGDMQGFYYYSTGSSSGGVEMATLSPIY